MSSLAHSGDASGTGPVPGVPMHSLSLPQGIFDAHSSARLESGYTVRGVLAVLGRHKLILAACVVLLTLTSAIIAFSLPPVYVAESMVILDTRRPEIVQQPAVLSNLVSGSFADSAIVRSEVALISSPAYARNVIERLDLLHNPEFQREMNPDGWTAAFHRAYKPVADFVASRLGRKQTAEPATAMGRAIRAFGRRLSVYNDEHSYAINLRYSSEDPAFATKIVNSLAEFYVSDQVGARREVAHKASEWLNSRLVTMQADLYRSERNAAAFEEQHHLETVLTGSVTEQRLHELTMQLLAVSNTGAQKQAELKQVRDLLNSPDQAAAAAQVLSSPVIQKLREQEADAAARVAAAKEKYNSSFPLGQARVNALRRQIREEIGRIATGLAGEVDAAKLQENALMARIREQQASLDAMNGARVRLKQMQQEVGVDRKLYETFLLRSQQVQADEQSLQAGARFVPAETPIAPSYPNKLLFVGFGFSGSLFVGILMAFLAEHLDETVRTPDDSERVAGIPTLGIVPRVRNGRRALAAIVDAPLSEFSEAINNILVSLRAGALDSPHRVVTVSSSVPSEGKTTVAAALARAAATGGIRTLLIDCDTRRAAVGGLFGDANSSALESMFLQHRTDLSHFVHTDEASRLTYLPTHRMTASPQRILGSRWMGELLARARAEYDLVILDTPPLLSVSDALLLSRITDTMLLVVRWGCTPGELVAQASKQLHLHSRCSIATVLSMVDMRKYAGRGSGNYYRDGPVRWYG